MTSFGRFTFGFIFLTVLIASSCNQAPVEPYNLQTDKLPPELKGLKVYEVQVTRASNGQQSKTVMVAVLNGQVNSVTTVEKHPETTIMVDVSKDKVVYETDSVIVLKK